MANRRRGRRREGGGRIRWPGGHFPVDTIDKHAHSSLIRSPSWTAWRMNAAQPIEEVLTVIAKDRARRCDGGLPMNGCLPAPTPRHEVEAATYAGGRDCWARS